MTLEVIKLDGTKIDLTTDNKLKFSIEGLFTIFNFGDSKSTATNKLKTHWEKHSAIYALFITLIFYSFDKLIFYYDFFKKNKLD